MVLVVLGMVLVILVVVLVVVLLVLVVVLGVFMTKNQFVQYKHSLSLKQPF